jgi:hypothetical protein
MTEMDMGSAGIHDHPLKPHEHSELTAEILALRGEIEAMNMTAEAAAAAQSAAVSAEVSAEEAYDARAEILALNQRIEALAEELRGNTAAVVVEAPPAPVEGLGEPAVDEPPVVENKPPKQRKKDGLSWF